MICAAVVESLLGQRALDLVLRRLRRTSRRHRASIRRSSSSRGTSRPNTCVGWRSRSLHSASSTGASDAPGFAQLERPHDPLAVVRMDAARRRADRAPRARHAPLPALRRRRGAPSAHALPARAAAAGRGRRERRAGRGPIRRRRRASRPRARASSIAACASAWYSATDASWSSSQIATSSVGSRGCAVRMGTPAIHLHRVGEITTRRNAIGDRIGHRGLAGRRRAEDREHVHAHAPRTRARKRPRHPGDGVAPRPPHVASGDRLCGARRRRPTPASPRRRGRRDCRLARPRRRGSRCHPRSAARRDRGRSRSRPRRAPGSCPRGSGRDERVLLAPQRRRRRSR